MNQRDRLAAAVHATCEKEWRERFASGALAVTMHGAEAHDEFADDLISRGVRVVDEGEHFISAATAEALRDVVRAYLANDEKGLLGACADLSAGMEVER